MGGIIIFEVDLNDRINYDASTIGHNFINVLPNKDCHYRLGVIFVNEKIIVDNKESYKLMLLPKCLDYDKKNDKKLIKQGKIKLYLNVNNEMRLIPNTQEKKDHFNFKNGLDQYLFVNIPASWIENEKEITLSYSATIVETKETREAHYEINGQIKINKRHISRIRKKHNVYEVEILNVVAGYFPEFLSRQKDKWRAYGNLLCLRTNFIQEESQTNKLDPVLTIRSYNRRIGDLYNFYLCRATRDFLSNYESEINKVNYIKTSSCIKGSKEINNFYNIKKISENIEKSLNIEEDDYYCSRVKVNYFKIKNTNKTNYSFGKNIVEEDPHGTEGILWNPLFNSPVTYERVVDLNTKFFKINYINNANSGKNFEIDYNNKKMPNKYSSILEYKTEDLNKIGWTNKEKCIDFIIKNEKKA